MAYERDNGCSLNQIVHCDSFHPTIFVFSKILHPISILHSACDPSSYVSIQLLIPLLSTPLLLFQTNKPILHIEIILILYNYHTPLNPHPFHSSRLSSRSP